MIQLAVVFWLAITLFLVALFAIPVPYRSLVWVPYSFLLPWVIRTVGRQEVEILQSDAQGEP